MADRRGDALLRAFARDLAKMRRDLRNLEAANQISSASIEGGTLDVYDDDDVLRERIGKQANGSYGRLVLEGPVPPIPSEPDVVVIADGVVAITWDGRSEEKWPFVDFEAVRVHLVEDPVAEVCDRDNQVGVIRSHRGETIVAVTESDDDNPVYARLVAVSSAGHTSDPSPAVLVDELDEDDLEEEPEELQWEDRDGHTLTQDEVDAGTPVTFALSHVPEVESLLAWWHPGGLAYAGVPQTRDEDFTVDWETQSITWPLEGFEQANDRIRLYYAYQDATASIGWEAPGWRYLVVDRSDTTDRSGSSFDDAGWDIGQAAFGNGDTLHHDVWPVPHTAWELQSAIWLRREVYAFDGSSVAVTARVDNEAELYWNGTLIGSVSGAVESTLGPIDVPAALIMAGRNVVAVRVADDADTSASDRCYVDVEVSVS